MFLSCFYGIYMPFCLVSLCPSLFPQLGQSLLLWHVSVWHSVSCPWLSAPLSLPSVPWVSSVCISECVFLLLPVSVCHSLIMCVQCSAVLYLSHWWIVFSRVHHVSSLCPKSLHPPVGDLPHSSAVCSACLSSFQ